MTAFLDSLNTQFRMKDLGQMHYFLGIQAHFHPSGLFLSQQKYAEDLLVVAAMSECSSIATPLPEQLENTRAKNKEPFPNPTYFRSLAGKLQYLTLTRPDIQFAVNFVCQKMHAPTFADFHLLKRILRYIKGTITMGLNFNKNTSSTLRVYSDSDHGGCKQNSVARSSTEAEYRAMSDAAAEISWICNILKELVIPQYQAPELYCDNLSAVDLTANPAFHKKSKHFLNHYHYVREKVALGTILVKHIPGHQQITDIFTKSLPFRPFSNLRYKLGVVLPPTQSLRGSISKNSTAPVPSVKNSALASSVKIENKSGQKWDRANTKVKKEDEEIEESVSRLM
ncbi:PREDICTED: uncharacterized protein LOC109126972 [Camelina sativa]|uniref:Uncharacterized protein LOC109126972 n=1 Tax=Camelina sativa TaxID=90675 RepID=A0ABM1QIE0_CAMSA|nr:PREDICTED: uncharacterized protein LOC109126972 [Camelina sativa]